MKLLQWIIRRYQVTAIYDWHNYLKEKREAMSKWSRKLKQILEEENEEEWLGQAKITSLASVR